MNYAEHRKHLVEWIRSQLTGFVTEEGRRFGVRPPGRYIDPEEKNEIIKGIAPLERFPIGVLYPIYKGTDGIDPTSEIQDEGDNVAADIADSIDSTSQSAEPVTKRRRYIPPSSVGFSFFVRGEKIKIQVICLAVRYEMTGKTDAHGYAHDEEGLFVNEWRRIPLSSPDGEVKTFIMPTFQSEVANRLPFKEEPVNVLGNRGGIEVLWRPFADGWIATVSLFNKMDLSSEDDPKRLHKKRNEKSLFEVVLRCVFDAGEVGAYPRVDKSLLTEEEQELELQYKSKHSVKKDWAAASGR